MLLLLFTYINVVVYYPSHQPENILICQKGGLDIKVADFGLAVQLHPGQILCNLVGTAEYVGECRDYGLLVPVRVGIMGCWSPCVSGLWAVGPRACVDYGLLVPVRVGIMGCWSPCVSGLWAVGPRARQDYGLLVPVIGPLAVMCVSLTQLIKLFVGPDWITVVTSTGWSHMVNTLVVTPRR